MKPVLIGLLSAVLIMTGQGLTGSGAVGVSRARAGLEEVAGLKTDQRIERYEHLLSSSPRNLQYETGLVSAYLQKMRETSDSSYLDRASKIVNRMLERDGGDIAALRFQNEIDLQRHDFQAVVERAANMAKYSPSDPGMWGNLGDASMELGEYERAGRAYTRMFSLRPNLASYNRLAYFQFVTGDADSAIARMRQAIEAGSELPENTAWCLAELGDMFFKTGKLDEAANAYRAAIELFPALHRAIAGVGKVEAARGHVEQAIGAYKRAQSIIPLVEYAGTLEDLYAAAGNTRRAKEQRDLIGVIDKLAVSSGEKTNRTLALILADHNRNLDRALSLMEAEIPLRGDVYTWDAISWVLFKKGRFPEARAASLKAVKLHTPEPLFYYHASAIASASGDPESARAYADRLASLNPKFDFAKTARR